MNWKFVAGLAFVVLVIHKHLSDIQRERFIEQMRRDAEEREQRFNQARDAIEQRVRAFDEYWAEEGRRIRRAMPDADHLKWRPRT